MVFKSYNSIAVKCDCGCAIMEFQVSGDEVVVSVYESAWYSHQGIGTVLDAIKHLAKKAIGKNFVTAEITLTRSEIIEFANLAEEFVFDSSEESFKYRPEARLGFEYFDESFAVLKVISEVRVKDLLVNKGYHAYELEIPSKEWGKFVKKVRAYVDYVDKHNTAKEGK